MNHVMAEVTSTFQLQPGDPSIEFSLQDPRGGEYSYEDVAGDKGTLLFFACNHCPYVIHLAKQVGELAADYVDEGIGTVAIMPNDVDKYPADSPDLMGDFADDNGWEFPYLYDPKQEVAIAYGAACTPDFFLFDAEGYLFYAGQFDPVRPSHNEEATGDDLREAIDTLLAGEDLGFDPYPSVGCNIKWKEGNEPDYFTAKK